MKQKVHIVVEKTDTGYSAYTEEMAVFSTGKEISDLSENLIEALNFVQEELGYSVTAENLKLYFEENSQL